MSVDLTTIRNGLVAWAKSVTGLTYAIWSDQDAPQPYNDTKLKATNAYVILRWTQTEQIGEDFETPPPTSSGVSQIIGNRDFMVFIQIKGKNAELQMNKLSDSFQKSTVRATLRAAKIIYVDNFPVLNITGLDDTKFIERASMDVLLRSESVITDTVGVIEHTEVTGTIVDQEGNVVYNEKVTIDDI